LTLLRCFLLAFPLPLAGDVVLLHQHKKTLYQVGLDPATHAPAAAHQTRFALPPLRVPALYDAGLTYLARTFINGAVLLRTEKLV